MKTLPLALGLAGLVAAGVFATLHARASSSALRALANDLAAARARATALDTQLATSTAQAASLEQRLTELDVDLGATKTRLTTSDTRNIQLSRELVRARADLATHTRSEQTLRDKLAALTRDRPVQAPVPASPDDLAAYKTVIADPERQLADARRVTLTPVLLATRPILPAPSAPPVPPVSPSKPAALVVGVGPANAFVILDYGAGRGVAAGQAFAIQRGHETVALARVTDVRPRFSIAHIQPNSLRGVLQKGDSAVITD